MKNRLARSVGLTLGLLVGSARAGDIQWRPAVDKGVGSATPPPVTAPAPSFRVTEPPARTVRGANPEWVVCPSVGMGQPVGDSSAERPAPTAALGRPVPLTEDASSGEAGQAMLDRQVRPVAYSSLFAADSLQPVIRTKPAEVLEPPAKSKPAEALEPLPITAPEERPLPLNPPDAVSEQVTVPGGNLAGPPFPVEKGFPPAPPAAQLGPHGEVVMGEPGPDGVYDPDGCNGDMSSWHEGPASTSWLWVSAEYLNWGIKDSRLPPLVTTGNVGRGVLGLPDTRTLFGGSHFDNGDFSGGRFGVGIWLNDCHTIGLEGNFLFLGERTNSMFTGTMGGMAVLARPFIDAGFRSTGMIALPFPNAELVSFPGGITGNVGARLSSQLWGGEANVRWHLYDGSLWGCCYKVDALTGFRYAELREDLTIMESLMVPANTTTPTGRTAGNFLIMDQFKTNNQFYGGQIGAEAEFRRSRWFLDLTAKLALGNIHQQVDINGMTTITQSVGGMPVTTTAPGGLLALPSNIGSFNRDRFAVLPELGIKIGYQVTDNVRLYAGYNILAISSVVRPANEIDPVLNITQLPSIMGPGTLVGPARPMFTFRDSGFWAQGVNLGVEVRY